jgi:hypothetical protein
VAEELQVSDIHIHKRSLDSSLKTVHNFQRMVGLETATCIEAYRSHFASENDVGALYVMPVVTFCSVLYVCLGA